MGEAQSRVRAPSHLLRKARTTPYSAAGHVLPVSEARDHTKRTGERDTDERVSDARPRGGSSWSRRWF
ncbi:hypothetical protein NL676_036160 [Syzygium grande]|nr:hypothetical protein NL676_036160 [Syzygium grande]